MNIWYFKISNGVEGSWKCHKDELKPDKEKKGLAGKILRLLRGCQASISSGESKPRYCFTKLKPSVIFINLCWASVLGHFRVMPTDSLPGDKLCMNDCIHIVCLPRSNGITDDRMWHGTKECKRKCIHKMQQNSQSASS
jgi:hypothetical protein